MQISLDKASLNTEYKVLQINTEKKLKKRLLDLGLIKSSIVIPLYKSPLNDPTSYLICDGIIALRSDDTKNIIVSEVTNND